MKLTSCIFALVLVTFTNAAPHNKPIPVHRNGFPPAAPVANQVYHVNPVSGYPAMPATIPQPPAPGAVAAKKNDVFAYLGGVPVFGNVLSQSSPQALESLGKSLPGAIEFPEVEDS